MTSAVPRAPHDLSLAGAVLASVTGEGRFSLAFEDPDFRLELHGPFLVGTDGALERYEPPCAAWVREVLETLVGVAIQRVAYRATGELRVDFRDERILYVPDGPYENWHLATEAKTLHGGVGRVA